jgi:hypothetical protein
VEALASGVVGDHRLGAALEQKMAHIVIVIGITARRSCSMSRELRPCPPRLLGQI